MGWTLVCVFSGWTAHAKYGLANELFVLKMDNKVMKDIREETEEDLKKFKKRQEKFNVKAITDCGNGSMADALGLQLAKDNDEE